MPVRIILSIGRLSTYDLLSSFSIELSISVHCPSLKLLLWPAAGIHENAAATAIAKKIFFITVLFLSYCDAPAVLTAAHQFAKVLLLAIIML